MEHHRDQECLSIPWLLQECDRWLKQEMEWIQSQLMRKKSRICKRCWSWWTKMVRLLSFQLSNFCFWNNCLSSRVWLSWPNSKKNFLSQLISRIYRTWTPNISTKFSTKVACKFLTNQRPSTEQTRECTSSTIIRIRTTTRISVPFIWRKGLSTISHKIRGKISAPNHRFLELVMLSLRILTFQQVL